jgi:Heterokaryon incompatibility protein (HET)
MKDPRALPKRLFDTKDKRVIFSHSLPPDAKYAAMSYVWKHTNHNNLSIFMVSGGVSWFNGRPILSKPYGIDWDIYLCSEGDFDRVVRDAESIGFRYVWIDCLCINQNSTKDKEEEIPNMGDYYRNCDVCMVYPDGLSNHPDIRNRPLPRWFKRVWTLQETVLPKRIVFCSRAGTIEESDVTSWLHSRKNIIDRELPTVLTASDAYEARKKS